MTKLTYANDKQIIDDAAALLVKEHLSWSDSDREMPSRDLGNVRGELVGAYMDAELGDKAQDEVTEDEIRFAKERANTLFRSACRAADEKWTAAKILLGIDE